MNLNRRGSIVGVVFLFVVAMTPVTALAHCQIPCGIYGDEARMVMIAEHLETIAKSIKEINKLSAADKPSMNQAVRWVQNKDKHADDIAHIVTYYFMAQRIKPKDLSDADYIKRLTLLHKLLVGSMKVKQSTDMANVEKCRGLLKAFHDAYHSH